MAISPYVKALDSVQRQLAVFMRPLGFRKSGRTFNRRVSADLIQVVNLQMGQYPIGDYVIPGIRESYYGRFTVNLGVALPVVPLIEFGRKPRAFIQESSCQIRTRLSNLVFGEDTWFDLDHSVGHTAAAIVAHMDRAGLPFLEEYESLDAVLQAINSRGALPMNNPARSALVGAMICVHLRRSDQARNYFERAVDLAADHKGFIKHVSDVRRRCGI